MKPRIKITLDSEKREKNGTIIDDVNVTEQTTGYLIQGPDCGRDKDGIFHCRCGKCKSVNENMPKSMR